MEGGGPPVGLGGAGRPNMSVTASPAQPAPWPPPHLLQAFQETAQDLLQSPRIPMKGA